MHDAKQEVERVHAQTISQWSSFGGTVQRVSDATTRSIRQTIKTVQDTLQIGKYKAAGPIAVLALVVIIATSLAYHYLAK
jgi:hypothetical protein